jgi:hypothetical protein
MKRVGQRNTKVSVFRSPELERYILGELAAGRSLTKICAEPAMPTAASVVQWASRDEYFRRRYLDARAIGAQLMADELVDLSKTALDQDSMARVQGVRVATDVAKWWLSKILPGTFGDHAHVQHDHLVSGAVLIQLPRKAGRTIDGQARLGTSVVLYDPDDPDDAA